VREQRSQPGAAGGRPLVWLGTGLALVFCLLMLFMPFAFQNEAYRLMYPVIRPFGSVFGVAALLSVLGLAGVGLPRWLALAGQTLLVLALTGWVVTQVVVAGLSPSLTGFLILTGGFALAAALPRYDQFLFRAVFAAMLLWMVSIIVLGRIQAPVVYGRVPLWVDVITLVAALLQPLGHTLRKRFPVLSWVSMLTVAAPLGWVTYSWLKAGNWMGVGIAATLTIGALVQGLFLRRPWHLNLPGMRRRILVMTLTLSVVPVLVLGALSTYRVQLLGREQSMTALYSAVLELDQQVDQVLRAQPSLTSDPAALTRAVGERLPDGMKPDIVNIAAAPAEWTQGEAGALEEAPPGQGRRLVAFRRRSDLGLIVAVVQPAALAYAGAASNSALMLLGAVLISALAMWIATLLSARITEQLEEVRGAIAAIGQHQYEVGALMQQHPDDEVSLLAAAVAEMALSLEASREEIQAQNEELQGQQEELATQNEELAAQAEELMEQNELLREMQGELRVYAMENAVVAELGQQALTETDLGKLAAVVADRVQETLGVSYSGIFELLTDGRSLLLRAGSGWAQSRVGHDIIPMDHQELAHVWEAREPVAVDRPSIAGVFEGSGLFDGGRALSGIEVAIRSDGHLLGFMGVYWPHQNRVTHQDLHFLQSLANKLATLMLRNKAQLLLAAERDL
jgi:HAMP domain-containing protein